VKRFNSICIITRDVPKLRNFYGDVLQVDFEGNDDFTVFSTEGARLCLFTIQGMEQMAPGAMAGAGYGGCALEFEVENVDREFERLIKLNIPIVKPPTTKPWGLRSVWFRDPDGNIINFYVRVNAGSPVTTREVVREYFHRLFNEKDLSVCDQLLSSDYRDHDATPDIPPGPKNTRDFVAGFLDEYPNLRVEIEDLFAEGNRVAVRIVWHGNRKQTGDVFHQMGVVILRVNDMGQIAERWSAYKSLSSDGEKTGGPHAF